MWKDVFSENALESQYPNVPKVTFVLGISRLDMACVKIIRIRPEPRVFTYNFGLTCVG